MAESQPQKGKQATKGQKQIAEENLATLKFYGYMATGAQVLYISVMYLVFYDSYSYLLLFLTLLTGIVNVSCLQIMNFMAKASYSETGQLLDGGIDLNMEAGIAEHIKDLIILTSGVLVLGLISNYFWLLWILAPARAFYMLWVNILAPWIFAPAPEVDEKKQKKMERRAKKH